MNLALSLKTVALIAFVVASTAAIVKHQPEIHGKAAMVQASANGLPLPASFH